MRLFVLPLLTLALALPVFAVDGVFEINQACAVNTGCFPGDVAGFPVTIAGFPPASASYRLTSNLIVSGANTDGILLLGEHITIDFNGFTLRNSAIAGTGNGVTATQSTPRATIKNGVITSWGGRGINLNFPGVRVENMLIFANLGIGLGSADAAGIQVGDDAQILRNRVINNGGVVASGIVTGANSLISENAVTESGGSAIRCGSVNQFGFVDGGCTVSQNIVSGSGASGIVVAEGSTILGNTAYQNGVWGLNASVGSTVSGNTAYQNGGDGIFADIGATVRGNTLRENGGFGLGSLTNDFAYRENVITNNTSGTVKMGTNRGDNFCSGPGTGSVFCP